MEIKKVLIRKDGIKYCIIPKRSNIKAGEMILITNDLSLVSKFKKEEEDGRRKKRN